MVKPRVKSIWGGLWMRQNMTMAAMQAVLDLLSPLISFFLLSPHSQCECFVSPHPHKEHRIDQTDGRMGPNAKLMAPIWYFPQSVLLFFYSSNCLVFDNCRPQILPLLLIFFTWSGLITPTLFCLLPSPSWQRVYGREGLGIHHASVSERVFVTRAGSHTRHDVYWTADMAGVENVNVMEIKESELNIKME